MAQFVVRNLEDDVRDRLRMLAQMHGRSMEEEVRTILRRAAMDQEISEPRLGSKISSRFRGDGLEENIAELRNQDARSADFDGCLTDDHP